MIADEELTRWQHDLYTLAKAYWWLDSIDHHMADKETPRVQQMRAEQAEIIETLGPQLLSDMARHYGTLNRQGMKLARQRLERDLKNANRQFELLSTAMQAVLSGEREPEDGLETDWNMAWVEIAEIQLMMKALEKARRKKAAPARR